MQLIKLIKSDYNKNYKYGGNLFSILFFTQGFWASFQYRVANYMFTTIDNKHIKKPIMLILLVWQKVIEVLTGISIPYSAQIGHSLYIGHFGGIIIHPKAIIGNNCNLSHGVTIGVSGRDNKRGVPIIGDNVYVASHAVLAGKITIGNGAVIAANSLVIADVDPSTTVMGVPAVKINDNNSDAYINIV